MSNVTQHPALNALERLDKKIELFNKPSEIKFLRKPVARLKGISSVEMQPVENADNWYKGDMKIRLMLEHKDTKLFLVKMANDVELSWHYHPERDEIINIIEGTLVVELFDRHSNRQTKRVYLSKDTRNFVIPAGVGHFCFTDTGALYSLAYEPHQENIDKEMLEFDMEIHRLLETTAKNSDRLFMIETTIDNGSVTITDCSENVSVLGMQKYEMIGRNVFDYIDIPMEERAAVLQRIFTKGAHAKKAAIQTPKGVVEVIGFLFYLGRNKITEYLYVI